MYKTTYLYVDQFGNRFYARTLSDLRAQIPGGISKMYIDRDGGSWHIGYIIGQHWLTKYAPVENPA